MSGRRMAEAGRRYSGITLALGMIALVLGCAPATGPASPGTGGGVATGGHGVLGTGGDAPRGSGGIGGGGAVPPTGGGFAATGGSGLDGTGGVGRGTGGEPSPGTGGIRLATGGAGPVDGASDERADSASGGSGGGIIDGGAPISDAGPTTFNCTQVMGLLLTSQWYLAGFEGSVDNAKWQIKWAEHSYIDEWAKPASPFWATAVTSPCAQGSTNPDRIIFTALSWAITSLSQWETDVGLDVDNIKTHYPNVKEIVLMTIIRGPGNKSCGNTTVVAENTLIPTWVDQALANVAARNPGLVKVGPKVEAASCADFIGTGPHLTAAGDAAAAKKVAAAFAP
jgi:hypothetical protein